MHQNGKIYVDLHSIEVLNRWKLVKHPVVDTELKFHGYNRSILRKIPGMSVNLLNSTVCRSREFMLLFCSWTTG